MTELLAAAADALGTTLIGPAPLGGSERSAVLRCQRADGGTVVVKGYPATEAGVDGYTAEAAGLELTGDLEIGPRLLAADRRARVIVMSDLGDAPSLADHLLGASAPAAREALLSWVRSCADLAIRTAGRQRDLAELLASHRPDAALHAGQVVEPGWHDGSSDGAARWIEQRLSGMPAMLSALSVAVPDGLADDLTEIVAVLSSGRWEVFSPGDICPDNNLLTAAGVRFIDFESAEFHSVFLDAAYLRMPFSSCWCVFRLPGELAASSEAEYRDAICGAFPELASDQVWQPGVRAAMAAWTLHAMTYLLDRSLLADGPMISDGRAAPTARQLLRHRWRSLHAELTRADQFPAVSELVGGLLAATDDWRVPDLPLYPAFRG